MSQLAAPRISWLRWSLLTLFLALFAWACWRVGAG